MTQTFSEITLLSRQRQPLEDMIYPLFITIRIANRDKHKTAFSRAILVVPLRCTASRPTVSRMSTYGDSFP